MHLWTGVALLPCLLSPNGKTSRMSNALNTKRVMNDVTTAIEAEAAAIALFLPICSEDKFGKRDYNPDK
jgi:hypothetical protein